MTFDEWYENLTADCPTWRTSLAMESARVVWTAAVAAERERCIATLRALKDRSGTNDCGTNWLVRLTRGDCIAALEALGPNVGVEPHSAAGKDLE